MRESTREKIQVTADNLFEAVKQLIYEGNVRRLIIKQGSRTVMGITLTVAAVGVPVAPLLAAIGALGTLAGDYTLEIERES